MNDFKLRYQALDKHGSILKTGTVICKRKLSKFDAICGYEKYLKNKDANIHKVQALSCEEKTILGFSGDFAESLKNGILGKNIFGI